MPKVCKEDIEALCPMDVSDEAHHLVCLRKHRNKITQKCWDELSELVSEGWEVLPNRFKQLSVDTECSAALIKMCSEVAPGYGALHQCVEKNWDALAQDCGLRRRLVPERVPPACEHDALVLCKHVIAGDNRVHDCLWRYDGVRNADGKTLSKDCLSSIILESHSMDIECAADMTALCGHDHRGKRHLVACLHAHQEKLAHGCTTRKHLHIIDEQHANRAPTHHNLHTGTHADGCADDIRKHCRYRWPRAVKQGRHPRCEIALARAHYHAVVVSREPACERGAPPIHDVETHMVCWNDVGMCACVSCCLRAQGVARRGDAAAASS